MDATVVMVARFAAQKAQAQLIRALEGIDRPLRVSFVGDGPSRADHEALACGSNLREVDRSQADYAELDWSRNSISSIASPVDEFVRECGGRAANAEAVDFETKSENGKSESSNGQSALPWPRIAAQIHDRRLAARI